MKCEVGSHVLLKLHKMKWKKKKENSGEASPNWRGKFKIYPWYTWKPTGKFILMSTIFSENSSCPELGFDDIEVDLSYPFSKPNITSALFCIHSNFSNHKPLESHRLRFSFVHTRFTWTGVKPIEDIVWDSSGLDRAFCDKIKKKKKKNDPEAFGEEVLCRCLESERE